MQSGLSLQCLFPIGLAHSVYACITTRAYCVNNCCAGHRCCGDTEHCGELFRDHFPVVKKKQLAIIPPLADYL